MDFGSGILIQICIQTVDLLAVEDTRTAVEEPSHLQLKTGKRRVMKISFRFGVVLFWHYNLLWKIKGCFNT